MKRMLIVAMALGLAHTVSAAEKSDAEKAKLAANLPKTVVVRISKTNPKDIAVIHSNKTLSANKDAWKSAGKFEQLAMQSQMTGKAVGGANELDKGSSTSSWAFGYYGVPRYYGYAYSPYRYYGYGSGCGYGYNNCYSPQYYYGYGTGCGYSSCGSPTWYTPSYYYGGYSYAYQPYYGYSDNSYYYAYCNYSPYVYAQSYYRSWWY